MAMIADILLAGGALGVGLYCFVLSRRLNRFNDLEQGMGGAVALLSVQVDDLKRALEQTKSAAADASARLERTTAHAEDTACRLERAMSASNGDAGARKPSNDARRQVHRRRRDSPARPVEETA
jgi:hypothetical protein